MVRLEKGELCVGLSEMQAFVRIETGEEEALLAGFLRAAAEQCENFINQILMERMFECDLTARDGWTLLGIQPVRSVLSVTLRGATEPLTPDSYGIDIDHSGRAFIRRAPQGEYLTVSGTAGMGQGSNDVPEPLRLGIVRLAAYLFSNRDSAAGELPAAVTALWRPYRRAGLCR